MQRLCGALITLITLVILQSVGGTSASAATEQNVEAWTAQIRFLRAVAREKETSKQMRQNLECLVLTQILNKYRTNRLQNISRMHEVTK